MAWQLATEQDGTIREIRTWGGVDALAWGWIYQPDVLMLLVDPEAAELAADVVEWFDDVNVGRAPRVEVADGQDHVVDALRRAHYVELRDQPFAVDQRRPVRRLHFALPVGYELHDATSVTEDARVEAHRAAWLPAALPFAGEHRPSVAADATSSFDATKLRRAQSFWPYDASRDLVITTSSGQGAGCCTVWLDESTGAAEIEPLGVAPEHRRLGVATSLCLAAVDLVARAGGTEVVIHPRGDAGYPAPRAAYAAAGFTEVNRTRVYGRVEQRRA
jgi:ribosomal protein S18 acetylase RimI-like enzyme